MEESAPRKVLLPDSPPLLLLSSPSSEPSMARGPQAVSQALLGALGPFSSYSVFCGRRGCLRSKINAWVRITNSVQSTDVLLH